MNKMNLKRSEKAEISLGDIEKQRIEIEEQKKKLWFGVNIALSIGVAALLLISIYSPTWAAFTAAFGTSLLIAGGSLTVGGLFGLYSGYRVFYKIQRPK